MLRLHRGAALFSVVSAKLVYDDGMIVPLHPQPYHFSQTELPGDSYLWEEGEKALGINGSSGGRLWTFWHAPERLHWVCVKDLFVI